MFPLIAFRSLAVVCHAKTTELQSVAQPKNVWEPLVWRRRHANITWSILVKLPNHCSYRILFREVARHSELWEFHC